METFYQLLSTTSKSGDPYLEKLSAITRASLDQMQAIVSDHAWQAWDEKTASS